MRLELYSNTGFNAIDIPDSPETLQTKFAPSYEEDNVNIIQAEYVAKVTIDISEEEVKAVDYAIITDDNDIKSCYTVESYNGLAPNTYEITLLIDAYNSLGGLKVGSGNKIISASANRLSISINDDNTKYYVEKEPFRPANQNVVSYDLLNKPSSSQTIPMIEILCMPPMTVEPLIKEGANTIQMGAIQLSLFMASKIKQSFEGCKTGEYISEETQQTDLGDVQTIRSGRLISPSNRPINPTTIRLTKPDGTTVDMSAHTRYWLTQHDNIAYSITVDGEVINGDLIKDFRDNGLENNIINYWEIPIYYLSNYNSVRYDPMSPTGSTTHQDGGIALIQNAVLNGQLTITAPTLFNNKAKYSQNITIKIFSPTTGDFIDKKIYEIVNPNTAPNSAVYLADYLVTADPRPQGNPIFMFKNTLQTPQTSANAETVSGATWRNIPLSASGVSNEIMEREKIKSQQNVAGTGVALQTALGLLQIAGGIGVTIASGGSGGFLGTGLIMSGAGTIGTGIVNFVTSSKQHQEQDRLLSMEGEQANSQIKIGSSNFFRDIGNNYFVALITQYSVADAVAYDTFLTRYGYNVGNMPITAPDLFSRPAFNFVRLNDAVIEAEEKPITLVNACIEQLKAGVRLWHKKPTTADMQAGGNR